MDRVLGKERYCSFYDERDREAGLQNLCKNLSRNHQSRQHAIPQIYCSKALVGLPKGSKSLLFLLILEFSIV